ncbi:hypothetical protein GCM10010357_49340 [Streptomyces luteireticuli]|uniref:BioF2-like acetyltransferase domain-containing protein n=2 Tax=Streptomyces luteireticuli TaxID=173858 RepID=A0ABP3IUS7_9ACTN
MTELLPSQLPTLLRRALGAHWDFTTDGDRVHIQHLHHGGPYLPPRRTLGWDEILAALEEAFAEQGVARAGCLPLHWGRETELTISAVQALDPLLKHGQHPVYRQGFLPQPVVRFTGDRDTHGTLRDGFLTSFVNVSRVNPIRQLSEYADAFDGWLTSLSRLGIHARHITFHGRLTPWRRRQVAGITLHFRLNGTALGDIVLLWHAEDPSHMAVDLGTGLERLTWTRNRTPWRDLVFGPYAHLAPITALDAIRTATLLLGYGIKPTARGAGSITRRVVATIPPAVSPLGFSAMARYSYTFWNSIVPLPCPWPTVVQHLDNEARKVAGHERLLEGQAHER